MGLWGSLVAFEVWDFATAVQICVAPFLKSKHFKTTFLINIMVKLKKTRAAGRFGARYGKGVKAKLIKVENKQRIKQKCPFCGKLGVKRLSKGIWQCGRCNKKFASGTYYLEE